VQLELQDVLHLKTVSYSDLCTDYSNCAVSNVLREDSSVGLLRGGAIEWNVGMLSARLEGPRPGEGVLVKGSNPLPTRYGVGGERCKLL